MNYNLHDTKHLIEGICAHLRSEAAPSSGGEQLATRYADECRIANYRLRNCGTMIANGDPGQALQLANQSPDLLEWVTLLEFFEQKDWKQCCTEKDWESAEAINEQDMQSLNEAYNSGLLVGDPILDQLFGQYRTTMITKDFARGLSVLRRINQINPSDIHIAAQLAELDRSVLAHEMQGLDQLLQAGKVEQVDSTVDKMEKAGFQTQLAGPVWVRAQKTRCILWLGIVQGQRSRNRWMEAERWLTRIRDTQLVHLFEFTPTETKQILELETWAVAKRGTHETQQAFEDQLLQVLHLLEKIEETLATKSLSIQRLLRDREVLYKEWRTLEQFFLPVENETSQRYRKLIAMMDGLIQQKASQSLWKKVGTVAASLLVLGALAWGFLSLLGSKDEARQLDRLRIGRLVATGKARLDKLHINATNAPQAGALGIAIAKLEECIIQEEGLLLLYKNRFQSLTNQFLPDLTPKVVHTLDQELTNLKVDLDALAPEFKVAESPMFTAYQNKWDQFIQKSNSDLNESFEKSLKLLEALAQGMAYDLPLPKLSKDLSEALAVGTSLETKKKQESPKIFIQPTISQRLDFARQRVAVFERAIQEFNAAILALNGATSLEDAQKAIQQLANSKLDTAPEVLAAVAVGAQVFDIKQKLINQLKLSANTTAYLQKEPDLKFIPDNLFAAEEDILNRLILNEMISIPLYRLQLRPRIAVKNTIDYLTIGQIPDKVWHPTQVLELKDKGNFIIINFRIDLNNVFIDKPENAFTFVSYLKCEEAKSFAELDLHKKFGVNGVNSRYSLLEKLEQLTRKGVSSPLFCAYLYTNLTSVVQIRPDNWGWSFSPTLQRHFAALNAEVSIANGDWYDKAKVKEHEEKFKAVFSSMTNATYQTEAKAHVILSHLTLKEGLSYVGYIDISGSPAIKAGNLQPELWSLSKNGELSLFSLKHKVPPFTLLFGAKKARIDLLKESGYDALGLSAKKDLPPFFKITAQ